MTAARPAPFDLFIVSIGTCAGIYVLRFLQQRGLSTEGAGITLRQERDPETKLVGKVSLEIKLPAGFPEKYRDAVSTGGRDVRGQAPPR